MQVLQVIFSGVAQGCIYGLIALGFVLIYKATETVTFAQGELIATQGGQEIRALCDDCTILMPAREAIVGREAVYLAKPI